MTTCRQNKEHKNKHTNFVWIEETHCMSCIL